jgi:hypothetical protein
MKKISFVLMLLALNTVHAETQNGFESEFYGFIKTSALYSSKALASFNNLNMSAPTHAAPQKKSTDNKERLTFQAQQSRMGVNLKKGKQLTAKLEFDFIDFAKSSPTTQMNPRVRIASVTYAWDNNKLIIGQDWDLFSPVSTFTFDYVGAYFLAGNTGFMRQQVQYLNTQDNWEFGAAVGMAGNNPGSTENDLELAKSPSYSGRISYSLEKGRVGASAIYSNLKYAQNNTSHDSYAYNLFFEKAFNQTSVKSEAYFGQNLANIGALSLGKGTMNDNVKEYGATLTMAHKLSAKHVPFAGIGMAKVDNKNSLTPFSTNPPTNTITNPGIKSNFLSRVGWEYKVTEDFSWVSEVSRFETKSKISNSNYQNNIAMSVESGIQLRF